MYYYSDVNDSDWSNIDNWWNDAEFTDPASSLPTIYDDVIISGFVSFNSGDPASVNSLVFHGNDDYDLENVRAFLIDVTVADSATFDHKSFFGHPFEEHYNTLTGHAIFDGALNLGDVVGATTFHGDGFNI